MAFSGHLLPFFGTRRDGNTLRAICHVIDTCISLCHHLYFLNQVLGLSHKFMADSFSVVSWPLYTHWCSGCYPVSRGFSLAWCLAFTNSFASPVGCVVDLFYMPQGNVSPGAY